MNTFVKGLLQKIKSRGWKVWFLFEHLDFKFYDKSESDDYVKTMKTIILKRNYATISMQSMLVLICIISLALARAQPKKPTTLEKKSLKDELETPSKPFIPSTIYILVIVIK